MYIVYLCYHTAKMRLVLEKAANCVSVSSRILQLMGLIGVVYYTDRKYIYGENKVRGKYINCPKMFLDCDHIRVRQLICKYVV